MNGERQAPAGMQLLQWIQRNSDAPVSWSGVEDSKGAKSYGRASYADLVRQSAPIYAASPSDADRNKVLRQFSNQLQNYVVGLSESFGVPANSASQLISDLQSLDNVRPILGSYVSRSPESQQYDLINIERAAAGMPLLGQRQPSGESELMVLRQKYRNLAKPHGPDISWGVDELKREIALIQN